MDLYGSCHDLLNKTLLLNQKYIDIFRNKLLMGEFFVNNKYLKEQRPKTQIFHFQDDIKNEENKLEKIKHLTSRNLKIDVQNSLTSLLKTDSSYMICFI